MLHVLAGGDQGWGRQDGLTCLGLAVSRAPHCSATWTLSHEDWGHHKDELEVLKLLMD